MKPGEFGYSFCTHLSVICAKFDALSTVSAGSSGIAMGGGGAAGAEGAGVDSHAISPTAATHDSRRIRFMSRLAYRRGRGSFRTSPEHHVCIGGLHVAAASPALLIRKASASHGGRTSFGQEKH